MPIEHHNLSTMSYDMPMGQQNMPEGHQNGYAQIFASAASQKVTALPNLSLRQPLPAAILCMGKNLLNRLYRNYLLRGFMIKATTKTTFLASRVVPFFAGANFSFSITDSVGLNFPSYARLSFLIELDSLVAPGFTRAQFCKSHKRNPTLMVLEARIK